MLVAPDYRSIDICKSINLGGAEESKSIFPPWSQKLKISPVETVVSAVTESSPSPIQKEDRAFGADRPGFINQDKARRMGWSGQVGGLRGKPDPDETNCLVPSIRAAETVIISSAV